MIKAKQFLENSALITTVENIDLPTDVGRFVQIPYWILADKRLNPTQKLVFSYLYSFNTSHKIAYPSNEKIALTCGINKEVTVQKALQKLEAQGFIKRIYINGKSINGRDSIHCAMRPEEVGDVPIFRNKSDRRPM